MKKQILSILLIAFGVASAQAQSVDFDIAAVDGEAYWYSRYNLGHLVMRSGLGEKFMPQPEMVKKMLAMANDANPVLPKAKPAENPALLKRVYNKGNPSWINENNGNSNDFANHRWAEEQGQKTTYEAFGWTMIKEVEWSKQFNVDFHFGNPKDENNQIPGAQQRFAGLVLCAEALMQFQDFSMNPQNYQASNKGQFVALWAISGLAQYLATESTFLMSENRCAKVSKEMGLESEMVLNKANDIYKNLPEPQSVAELSLAIQSLAWYGLAHETKKQEVLDRVSELGDKLANQTAATATERAYIIRGLIEDARLNNKTAALNKVASIFGTLRDDFNQAQGFYASQTEYTTDDVAVIIGAFNAMRHFAAGVTINEEVLIQEKIKVFENLVNKSGLQISAPPAAMQASYEQESEIAHRYPSLPMPPMAGGEYGIAPVFSAKLTLDGNGKLTANKSSFDSAGAMHLANEMIWFHKFEVNGFPEL